MPVELSDPEDVKIVSLARSTRARTGAAEGACVRDTDGRTYAAATVGLQSLQLSAVQLAVAMAASSGSAGLEAAAVLGESDAAKQADLAAVRDLAGSGVPFLVAAPDGTVLSSVIT
ncbi:MAG TPA: cytidine deaminase [Nocardioidaceae bacterium]|nr:cytidine deaminase [Nocardioidaceae bacterium]